MTELNRNDVLRLVLDSVNTLGVENDPEFRLIEEQSTRLYGVQGVFDSVGLVQLIAEIEDRISESFGLDLVLADERAMSQSRSPLRRVATLVDYVVDLAKQNKGDGER